MSVIGAAISIGVGVYGAKKSKKAADNATAASERGTMASIEEQGRQYDQTREDFEPWRESGAAAVGRQDAVMSGDMSSFQTSPGYNFRLDEGTRAMNNQFSNNSGGGNAMRALVDYSQNFASNEFGNWWSRNAGMSDAGRGAAGSTSMAGMNAANNNSSAYMANATNQGNVGMWNANNQNNMVQGGASNLLYAYKNRDTTDEKWWT
jgi:hypothetical protein